MLSTMTSTVVRAAHSGQPNLALIPTIKPSRGPGPKPASLEIDLVPDRTWKRIRLPHARWTRIVSVGVGVVSVVVVFARRLRRRRLRRRERGVRQSARERAQTVPRSVGFRGRVYVHGDVRENDAQIPRKSLGVPRSRRLLERFHDGAARSRRHPVRLTVELTLELNSRARVRRRRIPHARPALTRSFFER